MNFLQKIREIKNKVLNNNEQSPATLSAISKVEMFSPEVRDSMINSSNKEYYVVTSAQGLTRNQKVENITKEVLTRFFGNTLDGKNPVILKELSGFLSRYMDYKGKMTNEGLFPFGIAMNRKSGYVELVGENSSVIVDAANDGKSIYAAYTTHAIEEADTQGKEITGLVTETKNGQTLHAATLQIEDVKNPVDSFVFVSKGTYTSKVIETKDQSSGVVSLSANSEASYVNSYGQSYQVSKNKESTAFNYADHFEGRYREEMSGQAITAIESLVNNVKAFYDVNEILAVPKEFEDQTAKQNYEHFENAQESENVQ